jgi:hypothetical protein
MILTVDTNRIAQNATFTVLARLAMILCAGFGAPIICGLFWWLIQNQEDHSKAIAEVAKVTAVLQERNIALSSRVIDHETRIRVLERLPRSASPN